MNISLRYIPKLLALIAVLAAALVLSACGDSNDEAKAPAAAPTAGADGATTTADLAAACKKLDKVEETLDAADDIKVRGASDVLDVTMKIRDANLAFEELRAEVTKLPAEAQQPWLDAGDRFGAALSVAASELGDASGAANPARPTKTTLDKLDDKFDDLYDDIGCD